MPSPTELNTDPNLNTNLGPSNIAEHCNPDGINNAIRYLCAIVRTLYDQVVAGAGGMPITGGAFTGDITRQGRGGYWHFAGSSQSVATVTVVPEGTARPAASEGTVQFYYS